MATPITQYVPAGIPGRRYGDFTGKAEAEDVASRTAERWAGSTLRRRRSRRRGWLLPWLTIFFGGMGT